MIAQFTSVSLSLSEGPVSNSTMPLQVIFGMSLHLIIDVDERNQILTTNCWLTQKWNDSHLTWNSSEYGESRDDCAGIRQLAHS